MHKIFLTGPAVCPLEQVGEVCEHSSRQCRFGQMLPALGAAFCIFSLSTCTFRTNLSAIVLNGKTTKQRT